MILQMRDMLKKVLCMVERYVVEEHQMLMNLAHVADVRHHRQLEFLRHQADGQKLAHTCEPRAICLDKVHTTIPEVILEHDPVGDVFTGSNVNRRNGSSKFYVRMNVIRVRGLFNPERSK
jgi:hypothetical protein